MLNETSDSRGSGQGGSVGKRVSEKPPFKLCFPKHQMSGRSDVRVSKIDASFVTPKFYSREVETKQKYDVSETVKTAMKKESEKPRDLYRWPLLSSQSYGWWYDRTFGSRDPRFNHHKNTSELVRSTAMIHWQDQKMLSTTKGINRIGDEKINKPSFKLCFPGDLTSGRCTFHGPNVDANFVTPKFYTIPAQTKHIYDVSESVKMTIKEDPVKHQHIGPWPPLNSQSYGWWHDNAKVAKEIDESPYDLPLSSEWYGWWYNHAFSSRESRINGQIRDPMLVQPSEIIHWQDQKLFGLGHLSYA